MNLAIKGLKSPLRSTSLIKYLFYLVELVKERQLAGRFLHVTIKDNQLIKKYKIDYKTLVQNLSTLSIIKKTKDKKESFGHADKFSINKSRLLISLVECIGINCLTLDKITDANKEGFSFLKILNGIDISIKEDSTSLYHPKGKYEQIVVEYVYDFLYQIVHSLQFHFIYLTNWNTSSIFKFFQDISTGTSKYSSLSNKDINLLSNIHSSNYSLFNSLVSLTISFFFKFSHFNLSTPTSIQSTPLSSLHPISSSTPSYILFDNSVVYIGNLISLMSYSLLSHRSDTEEKGPDTTEIEDYLEGIKDFGINKFSVTKKELLSLHNEYIESEEAFLKRCAYGINKYLKENSPLFQKINSLIKDINSQDPLFPFVFNPKAELEESKNKQFFYFKVSGRQYNRLCDFKAHKRKDDTEEPIRPKLLSALGYDSEGFDISSTIWTIAKALRTGIPDITFDLKQKLVDANFCDKYGEIITKRKAFKPLNQLSFFCLNVHDAWESYNGNDVRQEFEEKFGPEDYWLEVDEETFTKIYYFSTDYLYGKNPFKENIFFYESILELSVIKRCYEEGIEVLNVYDCFFLKDKEKYPRLKELIKEELQNLIVFYSTLPIKWSDQY